MAIADFLTSLAAELADDPAGRGYAGLTAEQAAADLNEIRYITLHERMVTDRTLFAVLGAETATTLLDDLAASSDPVTTRVYGMLTDRSSGGVDIGTEMARGMIAGFVTSGLLTADQAATIMALGENHKSRAQQLGFNRPISAEWVKRCRGE